MTKTEACNIVAEKLKYTRGVTNVTKNRTGIVVQINKNFTTTPATEKQIKFIRHLCFWKFYANLQQIDKATAARLIATALEMKEYPLEIEVY